MPIQRQSQLIASSSGAFPDDETYGLAVSCWNAGVRQLRARHHQYARQLFAAAIKISSHIKDESARREGGVVEMMNVAYLSVLSKDRSEPAGEA